MQLTCLSIFMIVIFSYYAVNAQGLYEYWANEPSGCYPEITETEVQLDQWKYPIYKDDVSYFVEFWTTTLSSNTENLFGGMINFFYVKIPVIPVPLLILNTFLTDGTTNPPTLVETYDFYPGTNFVSNDTAVCIKTGLRHNNQIACQSVGDNNVYNVQGVTKDGATSWDLQLSYKNNEYESWCTANNTNKLIGLPASQNLNWFFYNPRAVITGNITINNKEHLHIDATGEQDHVFGDFLVGNHGLRTWTAGHIYNKETDNTFYFLDNNDYTYGFSRVETTIGDFTFQFGSYTYNMTYPNGENKRPSSYTVTAEQDGHLLTAKWNPSVPGLQFSSGTVQDIMSGTVEYCNQYGACVSFFGNGWTEVVRTTSDNTLFFPKDKFNNFIKEQYKNYN